MIAREYLRVSHDKSGREKSQQEQTADNRKAARTFGVDKFGTAYKDTGSASRHARKARDDFARLLADLDADRFNADVLVLWESSRGSRKVSEWCRLIELCETAGVRIGVTTHNRIYDPANARDRRSLIDDANDSEYEAAKVSERTKRDARNLAAEGKPSGPSAYGYRRVYDPTTRRLIAQEPDPTEAPIVVELFDRLAAGDSLIGIARDFEQRGVRGRGGKVMRPQSLRNMALNFAYIAKRVHSPNRPPGAYAGNPEKCYDAVWPALVSDETFYAVQARLLDPARSTRRPGRAKWLLSMIARCDRCGARLAVKFPDGQRRYQCHTRTCVDIDADALDAWAESEVLAILRSPKVLDRLIPGAADPIALEAARGEVAKVKAEHRDLVRRVGSGQLSAAMAAGAEPPILSRLAIAEARVVELTAPTGLRHLVEPGAQVEAQWASMSMSSKREVVRLLFSEGVVGVLSIAAGRGLPVVERIRLDGNELPSRSPARSKRARKRS
jgi:DNA invertase Pin-like site-specific DNA recombinase